MLYKCSFLLKTGDKSFFRAGILDASPQKAATQITKLGGLS
jgi:hypothetical protein